MVRYLLTLSLFVVISSCTTTDTSPANNLVGNWRVLSYCKRNTQPGTTGCTAVTIPADKSVIVSFTTNGQFNETYQNTRPDTYAFLGCGGGSYKLEGKQVRIQAVCMSSMNGQLFDLMSVEKTRLVINTGTLDDYVFERQ